VGGSRRRDVHPVDGGVTPSPVCRHAQRRAPDGSRRASTGAYKPVRDTSAASGMAVVVRRGSGGAGHQDEAVAASVPGRRSDRIPAESTARVPRPRRRLRARAGCMEQARLPGSSSTERRCNSVSSDRAVRLGGRSRWRPRGLALSRSKTCTDAPRHGRIGIARRDVRARHDGLRAHDGDLHRILARGGAAATRVPARVSPKGRPLAQSEPGIEHPVWRRRDARRSPCARAGSSSCFKDPTT